MKSKYLLVIILFGILASCTPSTSKSEPPQSITNSVKTDSTTSEITCPNCGHKKVELLPTEVCQLAYTCEKCQNVLHPKDGDCCVFCSYGDHKCPSKQ